MTKNADPDQLAFSEANWSGSALFAKTGSIRVQQDKGLQCEGLQESHCWIFALI